MHGAHKSGRPVTSLAITTEKPRLSSPMFAKVTLTGMLLSLVLRKKMFAKVLNIKHFQALILYVC